MSQSAIAVDQLIKASRTEEFSPTVQSSEDVVNPPSERLVPVAPSKNQVVATTIPSKTARPQEKQVDAAIPARPKAIFVEPTDPVPELVAEPSFSAGMEASYRPDWAKDDVSSRLPGKFTSVRRVPDANEPDQKTSIRAALDVIGSGTIEIGDNGPYFARMVLKL